MKLLPLIGALLFSAVPVQASKTPEEIANPCGASDAAMEACLGMAFYILSTGVNTLLCDLRRSGEITPKVFAKREKQGTSAVRKPFEKVMWNQGIQVTLEKYPNCPIKPIP